MNGPDQNKQQKKKKKNEEDCVADKREEGIGQGVLYSPHHAITLPQNPNPNHNQSRQATAGASTDQDSQQNMVVEDVKRRMGRLKDKVLDKLAAATAVAQGSTSSPDGRYGHPQHALENAKNFIETVIRDVSVAAQGITKDALSRIKSHLADIFPSLSPSLTSKMVDDAEKESGGKECEEDEDDEKEQQHHRSKVIDASPTSSLFTSMVSSLPLSKL